MIRLILIAGIIFGLTGLSVLGKPVKPDKPGKISDATQGKIDKIRKQAKSNDWAGIKRTYVAINWRDGDAVKSLKAVAKEVPNNKDTKELRREIKTKYMLLREDTNDILELADVKMYPIKIVYVPTIKLSLLVVDSLDIETIPIASLIFQPISIDMLATPILVVPYVDSHGIIVPFIRITDERYEQAMDDWSRRWNVAFDAVGTDGIRIIPNPRTALGIRRATLMHQIEAKGWTVETETIWTQYYQSLSIALGRRKTFIKKKRKRNKH